MDSKAAGVEGSHGNEGYSAESLYHLRTIYIYIYLTLVEI